MPQMDKVTGSDSTNKSRFDILLDLYAEGASDVEIAKELGITMAKFFEMERDLPAFAAFAEKGRTLSQAWWVYQARRNLFNKDFNTTLFNFNMKNRFGWADKVETTDKSADEVRNTDQLKSELAKAYKQLGSKYPEVFRQLNEVKAVGE